MDEGRGGGGGASKYKYKRKRKRNKGFGIAELCVHHGNLRGVPKKVLPSVGNIYNKCMGCLHQPCCVQNIVCVKGEWRGCGMECGADNCAPHSQSQTSMLYSSLSEIVRDREHVRSSTPPHTHTTTTTQHTHTRTHTHTHNKKNQK